MIKIIYLFIFLLVLILIKETCFNENFSNKINDYYILIIKNDSNKCNKYIFYNNEKSIIESDNKKCYWCLDKKNILYSLVKNNFNNNFNNVIIERFNDFSYNINLKGNNNYNYVLKKKDKVKYILYENDNPIYEIYHNNLNENEIITIRTNDFKKCAIITKNKKVFDNKYNRDGIKYNYKVLNKDFENKEVLGYSIFKIIQELKRDLSSII